MGETREEGRRFRATFFSRFLSFFPPDYVFHGEFDRTGRANTGGLSVSAPLGRESGKESRGRGEEEREKGRKEATPGQQLRCSAVQSRESSIDVAKHMLRSRREKGDWVYARRAQYLLSSWHSHLSSKAATKKGVLVLYRVATTIRVARDHRTNDGGGPQFALELEVVEMVVVLEVVVARSKAVVVVTVVVVVVVGTDRPSFHHQIRLPSIRFFRSSYR